MFFKKEEDPSIEDSPQDTAEDDVKPVTKQRGRPKKTVGTKRVCGAGVKRCGSRADVEVEESGGV